MVIFSGFMVDSAVRHTYSFTCMSLSLSFTYISLSPRQSSHSPYLPIPYPLTHTHTYRYVFGGWGAHSVKGADKDRLKMSFPVLERVGLVLHYAWLGAVLYQVSHVCVCVYIYSLVCSLPVIHSCIHTYIHTYIHMYIHTIIRLYTH